ncbi:M1 family aminopeptidase [uncultured Nonlabens sp.]|uniref:ABC transporter permease/M1 family aminopeptidase n=1 Tax=uncultured Nonlabens sp. TaxID=859306 RepID=UPI00260729BC|nr:M1 family aminopeptidase [uncultured Nonlabens sp.]
MFSTIYLHEIKTWFKKPAPYIFAAILWILALLLSALASGVFDFTGATVVSTAKVNSALSIYGMLGIFMILLYFLLPTLIGGTLQRDYRNNMHNVLYSYPITKVSYLASKFLAGFTITLIIVLGCIVFITIGFYLPGANEENLGPFKLINYLQPFLVYTIPNTFFYSAIIFAITAFFRNLNAAFIFVLILFIVQIATGIAGQEMEDTTWLQLLEPTGDTALAETIKYWTPDEQSNQLIPIKGNILYNRLIWLTISLIVFISTIFRFNFSQNPSSISLRKPKKKRMTKSNFGVIQRVEMPRVKRDFSYTNQLKSLWTMAFTDFKYIVKSWPFIIITLFAFLFAFLSMIEINSVFGTSSLPKTWSMLSNASGSFRVFGVILIALYGGFLMNRARLAHMGQILDVTPVSNTSMLISKALALFLMIALYQSFIMLTGMTVQTARGFYEYEIGLYLKDLFLVGIWWFIPWIGLSLIVHTLIKNRWVGFILLLFALLFIPLILDGIGIEQAQFKFNQGGSSLSASDMNGYGFINKFIAYRVYWIFLGIASIVTAITLYRRGVGVKAVERLYIAKKRFKPAMLGVLFISLIGFFTTGTMIWRSNNVEREITSSKEREQLRVNYEKDLSQYLDIPQPRIISVKANVDIYPYDGDYNAKAVMTMVNKSSVAIDSLHVNSAMDSLVNIQLSREADIVYENKDYDYTIYKFQEALQPNDTLIFTVDKHNRKTSLLNNFSPIVQNGTFLNSGIFPTLGYSDGFEIRNTKLREKYDLPPKDRLPSPLAPGATNNNYIGGNSDWIDFEATVSTSNDQIAIAPGYLTKEWEENDRKYFHYKMDSKILNFYNFMSGKYDVLRDEHDGVKLEIYYHPDHDYNINRMMSGLKDGLDYYNDNYTPYQHRQARIIEFPRTGGGFAQAFPNTIPFSEAIGFIADVDEDDQNGVDVPYSVTAHELAHQWWAHQVIGAKAKGMTLLSESLSEYSSLKVLETGSGKTQMRKFLKNAMDRYLLGRTVESIGENPLMFNENQQYIHYQKGSLVLYAMSDYLGEKKFNDVIKRFAKKYQFKEAPYPTSIEFVESIRAVTPDSLQYLVTDMFETITLYDNKVKKATYTELPDGRYLVNINALTSKYRSDKKGKSVYKNIAGDSISFTPEGKKRAIKSLPLADYIEVGVFGEEDKETGEERVLYLKKVKISEISNSFDIVVDSKPIEAGIDPFNILIDRNSDDNRMLLSKSDNKKEE